MCSICEKTSETLLVVNNEEDEKKYCLECFSLSFLEDGMKITKVEVNKYSKVVEVKERPIIILGPFGDTTYALNSSYIFILFRSQLPREILKIIDYKDHDLFSNYSNEKYHGIFSVDSDFIRECQELSDDYYLYDGIGEWDKKNLTKTLTSYVDFDTIISIDNYDDKINTLSKEELFKDLHIN